MDKQINMFPIGSVVYYIKDDCAAGDNRYSVDFGIVNGYLSSREIQVEMYIDQTLDRWAGVYRVPVEIKHQYRQWLMELDNIEEVETRVYMVDLQWEYWKNKTWNSIVLPM